MVVPSESSHLLPVGADADGQNAPASNSCTLIPQNDIHVMLALCSLIYTLAEFSQIAREHQLLKDLCDRNGEQFPESANKHELLMGKYGFISSNENDGQVPANPISPKELKDLIDSFLVLKQACQSKLTTDAIDMLIGFNDQSEDHQLFLNNFDAVNKDMELVYGITAMKVPKRSPHPCSIAVVFRGSVEANDWNHNVRFKMAKLRIRLSGIHNEAWLVENTTSTGTAIPMDRDLAEHLYEILGTDSIFVHRGFLQYLFAKQADDTVPKYTAIVDNITKLLTHRSFARRSNVTVTGHSLGGALATLLSFLLACDQRVSQKMLKNKDTTKARKCVLCLSFAAPYVGNEGFAKLFDELRTKGRLQHVRMTNSRDLVPLSPPMPSYRHTGLHVHLRPGQKACVEWSRSARWSFLGRHLRGWWTTCSPFIGCMLTTFPLFFGILYIPVRGFLLSLIPLHYLALLVVAPTVAQVETTFWLGLLGLQTLMLLFRRPWQVLTAQTHSLDGYYSNLDAQLVSSDQVLEDAATKELKIKVKSLTV